MISIEAIFVSRGGHNIFYTNIYDGCLYSGENIYWRCKSYRVYTTLEDASAAAKLLSKKLNIPYLNTNLIHLPVDFEQWQQSFIEQQLS